MSERAMITVRDPDIIAAEINTIKRNVQQIMIAGALEIGGKLTEAKCMVPHGQWGDWLKSKVSYSQSTANNLMRLYKEYGGNQQSLFDEWINSQMFAEMSYTQHLALLALPFSERQEFAETNHAAAMSTRELEEKIREELSGQYQDKLEAAERRAADAEADLQDAVEDRDRAQSAARDANAEANDYLKQKQAAEKAAQKAEADKSLAEKAEKEAKDRAARLEKELDAAQDAAKAAQDELQKSKKDPDIPEDVMAALRQEAAQKAAEDLSAQLTAAKQAAEKATQDKAAAEQAARSAVEKLAQFEKTAKLTNPDMTAIQTLTQSIMTTWDTILDHRAKAIAEKPDNADPLRRFLETVLSQMSASLNQ